MKNIEELDSIISNKNNDNKEVHPKNSLNDLNSKEWIQETVSVWTQKGLGANHPDTVIEKQHPAPFSFTDVGRLIRFFTKQGDVVLDPFLGIGSTLKACAVDKRKGIGIELNKKYADLSRQRISSEVDNVNQDFSEQVIHNGDSREVITKMKKDSVDFIVTSPPYWNILHKENHKAKQERINKDLDTRYSEDDPRDLGNLDDYNVFLKELCSIFKKCNRVLKPGKYMSVVVSDFRQKSRFIMFHADLANALEKMNFRLKGCKILYQRHKRIFPYGYPYSYVPNIHHQYILIFQNIKDEKSKL